MPAVCRHFAECHHGNDRVFVSCMSSYKTAIAFLIAEHILMAACLLKELDLLPDVFESGKCLYERHAVLFCDLL